MQCFICNVLICMTIGVIPKTVIDSMEYLMNFPFVKDVGSKSRSKKRHSFKGKKTTEVTEQITPFKLCLTSFYYLNSRA